MTHDKYILDANGDPQVEPDLIKWAQWFERADGRRIAADSFPLGNGDQTADVSTVFLGLDHNWGDGPPLLFETMVFGGLLDGEMDRYATKADALIGHALMCARVRDSLA